MFNSEEKKENGKMIDPFSMLFGFFVALLVCAILTWIMIKPRIEAEQEYDRLMAEYDEAANGIVDKYVETNAAYVSAMKLINAKDQQIADLNELVGLYGKFLDKMPEDVKEDQDYYAIEEQIKKIDEDIKNGLFIPEPMPSSSSSVTSVTITRGTKIDDGSGPKIPSSDDSDTF